MQGEHERLRRMLGELVSLLPPERLAGLIDNTVLRPAMRLEDAIKLIEETHEYGFYCAMIPPSHVRRAHPYAGDLGVRLCTVVGFPSGFQPGEAKMVELSLVSSFVEEVDLVAPLWAAVEGDYDYVRSELSEFVETARSGGVKVVKVIVEAPLVGDDALSIMVRASAEAGADYVKTSTGVYSKGGDPATVMRLAEAAAPYRLKVKAAGGIRTGLDAILAIAAGADRVGTSSAVRVIETYKTLYKGVKR
ncbi:MAG: deoxyribose-phosphate aldolase [Desulfurococcales archaeon]|nr:deoxyribose-phosphate aldolase [Desulfurococcales archaeon]